MYGGTKEEMQRLIDNANAVKEANGEMADLSIDSFADITEATKQVKKNNGEKSRYIVRESHEPIIDPTIYERVQRELIRRRTARPRQAGNNPFANRLVCGACGGFYGHKVWRSRGNQATRHDVWYCNERYKNEQKCATPTLREEEIKAAFIKVLKKLKRPEQTYTNVLWHELVEEVVIHENRRTEFHLADGTHLTVPI